MGQETGIQWCDSTFNPWTRCTKISPACDHCYAEQWANRAKHPIGVDGKTLPVWGPDAPRTPTSKTNWNQPLKWNREALATGKRHRVFCGSLMDVFEDHPAIDASGVRARLFALIEATPALDWLLLSKRWGTADIEGMVPAAWRSGWPVNVWAMATVENQSRAEERIPALIKAPAHVHGLSMEPLLGPVDLGFAVTAPHPVSRPGEQIPAIAGLDWIILGGESGAHARPLSLGWMRSLLAQGRAAGVAVFVKQMGEHANDEENYIAYHSKRIEAIEDGMVKVRRVPLVDRHGGEPAEWPADLRVREMPAP